MNMVRKIIVLAALLLAPLTALHGAEKSATVDKPNIVFVLADDLGYGDLGCYGQKRIKTPNLDRMAEEGMRFTQAYCGTSVCAPSRCALMTGRHVGHAAIRANREIQPEGQFPLPAGTVTVAKILKDAGYSTALVGKWGLGFWGSTGDPLANGFNHFFGYNCQRKAHDYYPEYLWRNGTKVELGGKQYSPDLMAAEALDWVRRHKERPFFLYFAATLPHAKLEVPDLGPYANKPWPEPAKKYAAMVSRLDRDVGRLLALLKELGLDQQTIVFFTSDNGADNPARPCLYWELYEPHFMQATRFGDWKAVRPAAGAPVEVYDLKTDWQENHNVVAAHPDVVAQAEGILRAAHVDSPDWPLKAGAGKPKAKKKTVP